MRGRILTLMAVAAAMQALHTAAAWAAAFSGGPTTMDLIFFPGDTAVIEYRFTLSSSDPECLGYIAEFEDVPEGLFASFDRYSEVRSKEVRSDPNPGGQRWYDTLIVGRPQPGILIDDGTGFPLYPRDHAMMYAKGIWEPAGGDGIIVVPGSGIFVYVTNSAVPQISETAWTFTNTSAWDIKDGFVLLQDWGRSGAKYICGFDVPAGQSLVVEGQTGPQTIDPRLSYGWNWAFGGILDDGSNSPVFSFDDVQGTSPAGGAFNEAFYSGVPTNALAAAQLAHTGNTNSSLPTAVGGEGRPWSELGYITDFDPRVSDDQSFSLYAFTYAGGTKVGEGTARAMNAPIPEPSSFIVWSLLATLGITVGCCRRRVIA